MSKYTYRIMHLPIKRYLKWWFNKLYSETPVILNKIFNLGKSTQVVEYSKNMIGFDSTTNNAISYDPVTQEFTIPAGYSQFSENIYLKQIRNFENNKWYRFDLLLVGENNNDVKFTVNTRYSNNNYGPQLLYNQKFNDDYSSLFQSSENVNFNGGIVQFQLMSGSVTQPIKFHLQIREEGTSISFQKYYNGPYKPSMNENSPIQNLSGDIVLSKNNETFNFTLTEGQKLYSMNQLQPDGIHNSRKQVNLGDYTWEISNSLSNAYDYNTYGTVISDRKYGLNLTPLCSNYQYLGEMPRASMVR